ncbi:hypothetical protein H5410_022003 [Solanum commersonii]|uniref:Uncharacterized protein n=1 Tax=Solanum commersonii TaxID=4109 RepID=A0A9J5ZDJ8_SOLCO|nr:hypothetical protein H5410_022003 [Solanum commersonii]
MLPFLHLCIHWSNSSNLTDLWFVEAIHKKHVQSLYQSLSTMKVFLDDTTKEAKDIETLKVIEKRIRDVINKVEDKETTIVGMEDDFNAIIEHLTA